MSEGSLYTWNAKTSLNMIDFYTSNGFVNFGKRNLDKDETDVMSGGYLVQMLRYLKN